MAKRKIEAEWAEPIRDLLRLKETHLKMRGKQFVVRSCTQGVVPRVVRCVEAQLPPTMRQKWSAPAPKWSAT